MAGAGRRELDRGPTNPVEQPRVRGENPSPMTVTYASIGSTPRMRGKGARRRRPVSVQRFNPACAGKDVAELRFCGSSIEFSVSHVCDVISLYHACPAPAVRATGMSRLCYPSVHVNHLCEYVFLRRRRRLRFSSGGFEVPSDAGVGTAPHVLPAIERAV